MCPVLSFAGIEIHAYALCTWAGALAACLLALPALKRTGMPLLRSLTMLAAMGIGFLVCARLWNVAVNPGNYASMRWYDLRLSGLSLYGGFAGAVAVLAVFAKLTGMRLLPLLDAMTVPGGVAFCIARAGCFLNGCCSGIATNGPFGVVFPNDYLAEKLPGVLSFMSSRPVHPTQLYELAGAAAGLAAVVLVTAKPGKIPGMRFLWYAGVFSAVRLAVLPLRALSYPPVVKSVLYPALYLCIIAASAVGICMLKKRGLAEPDGSCDDTGSS